MINVQQTQESIIHHAANFAAITIPVLSFNLNGPLILTYATGLAGLVWYLILIGEKIYAWIKRLKK